MTPSREYLILSSDNSHFSGPNEIDAIDQSSDWQRGSSCLEENWARAFLVWMPTRACEDQFGWISDLGFQAKTDE
jgi:hypothetical protein